LAGWRYFDPTLRRTARPLSLAHGAKTSVVLPGSCGCAVAERVGRRTISRSCRRPCVSMQRMYIPSAFPCWTALALLAGLLNKLEDPTLECAGEPHRN
jgi:hypothetical protein